ncbi:unnamed protein product [Oikopleura dioica]|uniref:Uncharacterized protein n=1 Tax=Oikopleura dioica TaxID=34765 RepID=E4XC91_OIKDI|nr:unnamed protein product [Oikopleura dioica]CBY39730.1 unnamed protein product [Oikopleura dioica]
MNSGWTLLIQCDVDHRPDETHLDENIKFVKVDDFVSPASSITIPLQQNNDSKLLLAQIPKAEAVSRPQEMNRALSELTQSRKIFKILYISSSAKR